MAFTITTTRPGRIPKIMRRIVESVVADTAKETTQALEVAKTAAIAKAHELGVYFEGDYVDGFQINERAKGGGELVNTSEHAPTVEFGRRPGAAPPPFWEVHRWVVAHSGETDPDTLYVMTQGLIKKIVQQGTPPRPVGPAAAKAATEWLGKRLGANRIARRAARKAVRGI